MTRRIATFLSALTLVPGLALGATNLIANPRFDADIGGWTPGIVPVTLSWSPLDEAGKPASGSLHLTGLVADASNSVWSSCFAVTPGAAIVFGAGIYSPAAPPPAQLARVAVRFYDGPDCSGSAFPNLFSAPETFYPFGASTWGPLQGNGTVPAGAVTGSLLLSTNVPGNPPADLYFDNAFVYEGETCAATATIACLNDRRFRVDVRWEIPDGTWGSGTLVPFSGDSARATFFDPANVELVLKVLDGCPVNERFWVFAAGLTNVEVDLRVIDTHTGEIWTHHNPLDEAFAPVQDTAAFADCPH